MISRYIKKNKYLFSLALTIKEKSNEAPKLKNKHAKLLATLRSDGVVALPSFFNEQECKELINAYTGIDDKYVRTEKNDRRVFGIHTLSTPHKKLFHDNELFKEIGEAYLGEEAVLQTTMAAKITPDRNVEFGSGGGWHRDSFSRQFKAVAYLNDVDINNGPFQYIKGSHKMSNIKKVLFSLPKRKNANDARYSESEIDTICNICNQEITKFVAPKGSVILADVRGIHTGVPIETGYRYSIFNYYIAKSFHQKNNTIEKISNLNY